ncbi:MAG: hypothetical protein U0586_00630 [Candidatus Brocadiaceae bacterium]
MDTVISSLNTLCPSRLCERRTVTISAKTPLLVFFVYDNVFIFSCFVVPSAATPQPILLYESGEIASEKTLAMTRTMSFDGTLHVVFVYCTCLCASRFVIQRGTPYSVIASEAKQSFSINKQHLLIRGR